jgi:hypothetical protein
MTQQMNVRKGLTFSMGTFPENSIGSDQYNSMETSVGVCGRKSCEAVKNNSCLPDRRNVMKIKKGQIRWDLILPTALPLIMLGYRYQNMTQCLMIIFATLPCVFVFFAFKEMWQRFFGKQDDVSIHYAPLLQNSRFQTAFNIAVSGTHYIWYTIAPLYTR